MLFSGFQEVSGGFKCVLVVLGIVFSGSRRGLQDLQGVFVKIQGILRVLVAYGSLGGFRVGLWRFKALQCVSQATSRGLRRFQRVFPGISESFKNGCREGVKKPLGSFQREIKSGHFSGGFRSFMRIQGLLLVMGLFADFSFQTHVFRKFHREFTGISKAFQWGFRRLQESSKEVSERCHGVQELVIWFKGFQVGLLRFLENS